ncbi:hypothetical protein T310_9920, partial [Rasamsonia emersonii CBS 393.64]
IVLAIHQYNSHALYSSTFSLILSTRNTYNHTNWSRTMPSNKCSVAASFPYPEAHTPPGSPRLTSDQCISRGELKDLFKAVLEERSASSYEGPACRPEGLKKDGDGGRRTRRVRRVRASK